MKRRDYEQFCGLARATELLGERWTLLIVRELLARPCRYTDLLEGLPGIPTNLLSTRLKELEAEGIVERRVAVAPQRGVVYALTPEGESLEGPVIALARWGNGHLGERAGQMVPASTLALSLRAMFDARRADGVNATWELRAADAVVHVAVREGHLTTGVGPSPEPPDLVIAIAVDEVPTFRDIMQALDAGQVDLTGRRSLARTFAKLFAPQPA